MPAAYDRCVRAVKTKGGVANPYAACRASMGTNEEIMKKKSKKPMKKKGY